MENLNSQTAELFEAVRRSDIRQVKRLLAANVSPTQCNENGQTALTIAAQTGDTRVMQILCLAATNRQSTAQIFLYADTSRADRSPWPTLSEINSAAIALPTPGLTPQPTYLPLAYESNALLSNPAHSLTNPEPVFTNPEPVFTNPEPVFTRSETDSTATDPSTPTSHPDTASQAPETSQAPEIEKQESQKERESQTINIPPEPQPSIESLELAVHRNDLKAVNALLKAGVDCRPRHWYDTPLLVIAAQKGYGDIAQSLIDAGANVHIGYSQLPLHAAAANGHLDVVQRLLNSGAYIHAETEGGRTALMEAADGGHFLVTELLLARGANINASCRGETALMLAARGRHRAVYELLYPLVPPAGRVPFPKSMEHAWQLSLQVQ